VSLEGGWAITKGKRRICMCVRGGGSVPMYSKKKESNPTPGKTPVKRGPQKSP